MSAAALLPSVSKEVRALAVPWMVCVACMVAIAITNEPRIFGPLALFAYLVGTVALGALSIGHEYTGRTLGLLLTLPVRRGRLLATKFSVLLGMLLTLWLVAEAVVFSNMPAPADARQMTSLIPVVCALFLAPWLTMVCRSAIAGAVFALTIPGVLMVIGELLGVAMYGHGSVMEAFWKTFMWYGTLGPCAIGALMTWRMFTRLEAIEGPGQDVRLPQWLTAGSAASTAAPQFTRRSPVWLLVKKELRLQQLPLVLTALYVLEFVAFISAATVLDAKYGYLFSGLTFLHAGLLPLLLGSGASAGERQMDTLQWQLLLPMANATQWAVKLVVVFGLVIALGLALPAGLLAVSPWASASPIRFAEYERLMMPVMLIAAGSLYVSSLCRSSLWALLMSLPIVPVSAWLLQFSVQWLARPTYLFVRKLTGESTTAYSFYFGPPRIPSYVLIAGFLIVVLRFALINHRSADRPAARVWTQVILMATFAAAAMTASAAWQALR